MWIWQTLQQKDLDCYKNKSEVFVLLHWFPIPLQALFFSNLSKEKDRRGEEKNDIWRAKRNRMLCVCICVASSCFCFQDCGILHYQHKSSKLPLWLWGLLIKYSCYSKTDKADTVTFQFDPPGPKQKKYGVFPSTEFVIWKAVLRNTYLNKYTEVVPV